MYIHVKSGRETNVRPQNDVDVDATGHPQWNDEYERRRSSKSSSNKRSILNPVAWVRGSQTTVVPVENGGADLVAAPRTCGRCGKVTGSGVFKFCADCGNVLPDAMYHKRLALPGSEGGKAAQTMNL